jgi:hypothetical protein
LEREGGGINLIELFGSIILREKKGERKFTLNKSVLAPSKKRII